MHLHVAISGVFYLYFIFNFILRRHQIYAKRKISTHDQWSWSNSWSYIMGKIISISQKLRIKNAKRMFSKFNLHFLRDYNRTRTQFCLLQLLRTLSCPLHQASLLSWTFLLTPPKKPSVRMSTIIIRGVFSTVICYDRIYFVSL